MRSHKIEKSGLLTIFLIIFLISFLISSLFWWKIAQNYLEDFFFAYISQPFQNMAEVKIPEKPNLESQAKAAISVKISKTDRQKILFKKNINQVLPIASLTKLMTALVVFENESYDLENGSTTISKEAAGQRNAPNYGHLDFDIGKKFSFKNLLDLMLIYSSNDAAWALAEIIGVENFMEKMNQKAIELGLENTHFFNPHGLDPENLHYNSETLNYFNYSTAKDLVKLAQYILKEHPLIFEISLKDYNPPTTPKVKDGIFDLFLTQKVVGGKTGYTNEAGGCILFVFKDGRENSLINIILGAPSQPARIAEMQKLINWLNL